MQENKLHSFICLSTSLSQGRKCFRDHIHTDYPAEWNISLIHYKPIELCKRSTGGGGHRVERQLIPVTSKTQPMGSRKGHSCIPSHTGLDVHPCWLFVWCWEDFPLINVQLSPTSRLCRVLKRAVDKTMRSKCQGHGKQKKVEELSQDKGD